MRTLLASGAILVALGIAAAPASAGPCAAADATSASVSTQRLANAAICLLNQERAKHGLSGLRVNRRLSAAATRHARDMAARRYFSHDTKGGGSFADRIARTGYSSGNPSLGENIAWGSGNLGSPRAIVRSWMNSPGHRANILNRRFREIGIGVAIGDVGVGQRGATYATDFGSGGRG
jgi:uncharacterized protein YkwD